jgi:hypothetical protein
MKTKRYMRTYKHGGVNILTAILNLLGWQHKEEVQQQYEKTKHASPEKQQRSWTQFFKKIFGWNQSKAADVAEKIVQYHEGIASADKEATQGRRRTAKGRRRTAKEAPIIQRNIRRKTKVAVGKEAAAIQIQRRRVAADEEAATNAKVKQYLTYIRNNQVRGETIYEQHYSKYLEYIELVSFINARIMNNNEKTYNMQLNLNLNEERRNQGMVGHGGGGGIYYSQITTEGLEKEFVNFIFILSAAKDSEIFSFYPNKNIVKFILSHPIDEKDKKPLRLFFHAFIDCIAIDEKKRKELKDLFDNQLYDTFISKLKRFYNNQDIGEYFHHEKEYNKQLRALFPYFIKEHEYSTFIDNSEKFFRYLIEFRKTYDMDDSAYNNIKPLLYPK